MPVFDFVRSAVGFHTTAYDDALDTLGTEVAVLNETVRFVTDTSLSDEEVMPGIRDGSSGLCLRGTSYSGDLRKLGINTYPKPWVANSEILSLIDDDKRKVFGFVLRNEKTFRDNQMRVIKSKITRAESVETNARCVLLGLATLNIVSPRKSVPFLAVCGGLGLFGGFLYKKLVVGEVDAETLIERFATI